MPVMNLLLALSTTIRVIEVFLNDVTTAIFFFF